MALVVYDRVQQTGTANTTVSFTLSGSVTGYQSFSVVGNGNTTYYSSVDTSGNWEVGLGTYSTTGPTLTRTTILSSSNSGSAVTFSGTVNVWIDYPAPKAIYQNTAGYIAYDFTNATITSRLNFQTSTANSTTGIYALPSGTSTAASWQATNNSDPTNASKVLIATNGSTDVQLVSGRNGTGTYLPLSFYTNGSQGAQLDTSYNFKANGQLIAGNGLHVNSQTVSVSYSIPSGSSAMSAGPITVASGVTVTIPSGSRWVVV